MVDVPCAFKLFRLFCVDWGCIGAVGANHIGKGDSSNVECVGESTLAACRSVLRPTSSWSLVSDVGFWGDFFNINPLYWPEIPNMYLSGTFVKLQDVQFLLITCVTFIAFTEYSWYFDSEGDLQPSSTHIPKGITAIKLSDSSQMKNQEWKLT